MHGLATRQTLGHFENFWFSLIFIPIPRIGISMIQSLKCVFLLNMEFDAVLVMGFGMLKIEKSLE